MNTNEVTTVYPQRPRLLVELQAVRDNSLFNASFLVVFPRCITLEVRWMKWTGDEAEGRLFWVEDDEIPAALFSLVCECDFQCLFPHKTLEDPPTFPTHLFPCQMATKFVTVIWSSQVHPTSYPDRPRGPFFSYFKVFMVHKIERERQREFFFKEIAHQHINQIITS